MSSSWAGKGIGVLESDLVTVPVIAGPDTFADTFAVRDTFAGRNTFAGRDTVG
jgi:hypothetical protein